MTATLPESAPETKRGCLPKLLFGLGIVAGLFLLAAVAVLALSELHLRRSHDIAVAAITVPTDLNSIARGEHLVTVVAGCRECHGYDLGGAVLSEEDMLGQIIAPNLTAGEGGIGSQYSNEDWVRFFRHGVGRDGKALVLVSSKSLFRLTEQDMAAAIAYLRTVPAVDRELPEMKVGFLGRLLIVLVPSTVPVAVLDHEAPPPTEPSPGVTVAYGEYLASMACIDCHQDDFAGGTNPGAGRNLTQQGDLADWSEADFIRTVRYGITPDNTFLDSAMMPFRRFRNLTDEELQAIWLFLQTLSPVYPGAPAAMDSQTE